ncbi:MAG: hypothetical protein NkDv07_0684 [Candidatus Improbicoccus devescovinae]|nr:MAG: hypothetical protein NkDv07_0684 [Candidatus Improbicoccus devescovinae]
MSNNFKILLGSFMLAASVPLCVLTAINLMKANTGPTNPPVQNVAAATEVSKAIPKEGPATPEPASPAATPKPAEPPAPAPEPTETGEKTTSEEKKTAAPASSSTTTPVTPPVPTPVIVPSAPQKEPPQAPPTTTSQPKSVHVIKPIKFKRPSVNLTTETKTTYDIFVSMQDAVVGFALSKFKGTKIIDMPGLDKKTQAGFMQKYPRDKDMTLENYFLDPVQNTDLSMTARRNRPQYWREYLMSCLIKGLSTQLDIERNAEFFKFIKNTYGPVPKSQKAYYDTTCSGKTEEEKAYFYWRDVNNCCTKTPQTGVFPFVNDIDSVGRKILAAIAAFRVYIYYSDIATKPITGKHSSKHFANLPKFQEQAEKKLKSTLELVTHITGDVEVDFNQFALCGFDANREMDRDLMKLLIYVKDFFEKHPPSAASSPDLLRLFKAWDPNGLATEFQAIASETTDRAIFDSGSILFKVIFYTEKLLKQPLHGDDVALFPGADFVVHHHCVADSYNKMSTVVLPDEVKDALLKEKSAYSKPTPLANEGVDKASRMDFDPDKWYDRKGWRSRSILSSTNSMERFCAHVEAKHVDKLSKTSPNTRDDKDIYRGTGGPVTECFVQSPQGRSSSCALHSLQVILWRKHRIWLNPNILRSIAALTVPEKFSVDSLTFGFTIDASLALLQMWIDLAQTQGIIPKDTHPLCRLVNLTFATITPDSNSITSGAPKTYATAQQLLDDRTEVRRMARALRVQFETVGAIHGPMIIQAPNGAEHATTLEISNGEWWLYTWGVAMRIIDPDAFCIQIIESRIDHDVKKAHDVHVYFGYLHANVKGETTRRTNATLKDCPRILKARKQQE